MLNQRETHFCYCLFWKGEIAAEVLRQRSIDVETVITDIIPLDDIQKTFQALLKPATNNMLRVLVAP